MAKRVKTIAIEDLNKELKPLIINKSEIWIVTGSDLNTKETEDLNNLLQTFKH